MAQKVEITSERLGTAPSMRLNTASSNSSAKSVREATYSLLCDEELADGYKAHQVVPDVLDNPPAEKLTVSFSECSTLGMGNLLTPDEVSTKPNIDLTRYDPKKFYSLIMTDPDVPNRAMPMEREHLHWLVVNITRNDVNCGEEIVPYSSPLPKQGSGLHRYVFMLLEQSRPIVIATAAEKAALAAIANNRPVTREQLTISSTGKETLGTRALATGIAATKKELLGVSEAKNGTSTPKASVVLIDRVKFSTKEFMSKYCIMAVVAGNFFQTEYNDYVGKQLAKVSTGVVAVVTDPMPEVRISGPSPPSKKQEAATSKSSGAGASKPSSGPEPTKTVANGIKGLKISK